MEVTDSTKTNIVPARFYPVTMTGPDPATHYGPLSREVFWYCPSYTVYFEEITPNSTKDHHTWKAFEHYLYSAQSGGVNPGGALVTADLIDSNVYLDVGTCLEPYVLAGTCFGSSGRPNNGLPEFYTPRTGGGFVPAPSNINDLIAWSLRSMLPTVKGQLSLLNTLFELKDMVSVKRSIGLLAQNIRNFTSRLGGRSLGMCLKDLSRLSADHYLQWSFNVSPLISDLRGIYRAISTYEKRINALISREGRTRTSHFTKFITEPQFISGQTEWSANRTLSPVSYEGNGYPAQMLLNDRKSVTYEATAFHAQIQYNYNYTGFQREHARVLALLDSLGINLNPAIIWNALPWSFVVDWLVGVGRWLNDLSVGNMEPQINILQYCWSVKRSRVIHPESKVAARKYYTGYDYSTFYPVQYISYPAVHEVAYRRDVGLPDRGLFETSGLSSKEFSLGAALVISHRRHRKRRR